MKMRRLLSASSLLVFLLAPRALAAPAGWLGAKEDYNLFGHLENDGPLCAPTATASSFAYLQNRYPGVYGQNLVGPRADLSEVRDELAHNMCFSARPGLCLRLCSRW
jgi:hypothetical protein